jgi:hypothetical protein
VIEAALPFPGLHGAHDAIMGFPTATPSGSPQTACTVQVVLGTG